MTDGDYGTLFPRMNPEVKARWVADLRSGRHRQVHSFLCRPLPQKPDEIGYCCLGRLADLVDPEGWSVSEFTGTREHRGNTALLSSIILEKSGLDWFTQEYLVALNDERLMTFEGIADYVEEYL